MIWTLLPNDQTDTCVSLITISNKINPPLKKAATATGLEEGGNGDRQSISDSYRRISQLLFGPHRISGRRVQAFVPEDLGQSDEIAGIVFQATWIRA